jgi:hypothetical protein
MKTETRRVSRLGAFVAAAAAVVGAAIGAAPAQAASTTVYSNLADVPKVYQFQANATITVPYGYFSTQWWIDGVAQGASHQGNCWYSQGCVYQPALTNGLTRIFTNTAGRTMKKVYLSVSANSSLPTPSATVSVFPLTVN